MHLLIQRWFYSTNQKDIGTLYLLFGTFSGIMGTALFVLIRLELSTPGNHFFLGNNQLYTVRVTAHALVLVFFMVTLVLVERFNFSLQKLGQKWRYARNLIFLVPPEISKSDTTYFREELLDANYLCPVWEYTTPEEFNVLVWTKGANLLVQGFWVFLFIFFLSLAIFFGVKKTFPETKNNVFFNIFLLLFSFALFLPVNFTSVFPAWGCYVYNLCYSFFSPLSSWQTYYLILSPKIFCAALAGGCWGQHAFALILTVWEAKGKQYFLDRLRRLEKPKKLLFYLNKKIDIPESKINPAGPGWPRITVLHFALPLYISFVGSLTKIPTPIVFLAGAIFFSFLFLHIGGLRRKQKEFAVFFQHSADILNCQEYQKMNGLQKFIIRWRTWQLWYVASVIQHPLFLFVFLVLFTCLIQAVVPAVINHFETLEEIGQVPLSVLPADWGFFTNTYPGQVISLLGGALSLFSSSAITLLIATQGKKSSFYKVFDRQIIYGIVGNPSSTLKQKLSQAAVGATVGASGCLVGYGLHHHAQRTNYQTYEGRVTEWNKTVPLKERIPPSTQGNFYQTTSSTLPVNPMQTGGPQILPRGQFNYKNVYHYSGYSGVGSDFIVENINKSQELLKQPPRSSKPKLD